MAPTIMSKPTNAKPPAKIAPGMELGVLSVADRNLSINAVPIPRKGIANTIRNAAPALDGLLIGWIIRRGCSTETREWLRFGTTVTVSGLIPVDTREQAAQICRAGITTRITANCARGKQASVQRCGCSANQRMLNSEFCLAFYPKPQMQSELRHASSASS